MGVDKFENEKLIKWGWPEDVWFHVDDLSSAHVYVRAPMPKVSTDTAELAALPKVLVTEMAQLTKANSIEGCKRASVDVVYTKWENLQKTDMMEVGTVGFKDSKAVLKVKHVSTDKEMVKKLEKTKVVDTNVKLDEERAARDRRVADLRRVELHRQREAKKEADRLSQEARDLRNYTSLQGLANEADLNTLKGDGSIESCKAIEEDFM